MAGFTYLGTKLIGYSTKKNFARFGDIMLAPGPMYKDSNTYGICDPWNQYNSYGESFMGPTIVSNNPITHFKIQDLGDKFDSSGSDWSATWQSQTPTDPSYPDLGANHTIDNGGTLVSYGGFSDWRMMTVDELQLLLGGYYADGVNRRPGSTLVFSDKSVTGACSWFVVLADNATISARTTGVLVLPDDKTFDISTLTAPSTGSMNSLICTGNAQSQSHPYLHRDFRYSDPTFSAIGVHADEISTATLNSMTAKGCVFMANIGRLGRDTTNDSFSWIKTCYYPTTHLYTKVPSAGPQLRQYKLNLNSPSYLGNYNYMLIDSSAGDYVYYSTDSFGYNDVIYQLNPVYLVRDYS